MEKTKDSNITFKWKQWYWYFSLLANALPVLFLSIFLIVIKKVNNNLLDTALYPIFISFTLLISILALFTYFYMALKDYKIKQVHIKKKRINNFYNGILSSTILLVLYGVTIIVIFTIMRSHYVANTSITNLADQPFYPGNVSSIGFGGIMIGFIILVGFFSGVFLTFFQFSSAFDVYAKIHKSEIAQAIQAEERRRKGKEIDWNKIAKNSSDKVYAKGENKWSSHIGIYQNVKDGEAIKEPNKDIKNDK